jgi:hypothetical protein
MLDGIKGGHDDDGNFNFREEIHRHADYGNNSHDGDDQT